MLHDRLLVETEDDTSERHSSGGLVIPATAVGPKKLAWAVVRAAGSGVRNVSVGDRILFDPEARAEVDISGVQYVLLREKDLHAVWAPEAAPRGSGLYL